MKKHKRKIQTGIVIGIFSVIIIACLISIFSRMYTENKEKEAFRQLAEIVTEDTTDATIEETIKKPNMLKVSDFDNEVQAEQTVYCTTYYEPHSISELISMNSECFGWISIAGTNINYPVMHTPSNPQKYLNKNFYGEYSFSGTPFLDSKMFSRQYQSHNLRTPYEQRHNVCRPLQLYTIIHTLRSIRQLCLKRKTGHLLTPSFLL